MRVELILVWALKLVCSRAPGTYPISNALDCESSSAIYHSPLRSVCNTKQKRKIAGLTKIGQRVYSIIQQDDVTMVKGLRCTKQVSTFEFYCGMYSHAIWVDTPTLLRNEEMTEGDCARMQLERLYINEKSEALRVPLGDSVVVEYSFIKAGTLFHDMSTAYCENGADYEKGFIHKNLVKMVDVKVTMEVIDVEIKKDVVKDLKYNTVLPSDCMTHLGNCILPTATYVIKRQVTRYCHLFWVRQDVEFEEYEIRRGASVSQILVSEELRLLFVRGELINGTWGTCFHEKTSMVQTQLKDIFLITAAPGLHRVMGESIHMDLEVKVAESYVLFKSQAELLHLVQVVDQRFCTTDVKTLPFQERSPFAPNHLIRVSGELISELSCKEVLVYADMEYRDEQCYNAIPVIHGETKTRQWILPGSRILITPQELVPVHCRYAPKIIVNDTVIGMGNKQLSILDIQLRNRTFQYHREIDTWSDFGLDYVNQFVNMMGGGDDNLYTKKEMDEFLDLVRFDRMGREVTNIVTNAYCAEQQCTHYGKNSGFLDLDLSPLINPAKQLDPYKVLISPVQEYIDRFRDFLAMFTFYLFVEWVVRKIWALWYFLIMVYQGEFSRKDALLISFNPGGQLIQSFREHRRRKRAQQPYYYEAAADENGAEPWRLQEPEEERTVTLL